MPDDPKVYAERLIEAVREQRRLKVLSTEATRVAEATNKDANAAYRALTEATSRIWELVHLAGE
jgi:hypothetical protein